MFFLDNELQKINRCPWCGAETWQVIYKTNCNVNKCSNCGFVFADKILNNKGRYKYWNNYCQNVHLANIELNRKREKMYKLDAEFIDGFMLDKKKEVLDIGCSKGEFLDVFKSMGYECFGIEYDDNAAKDAKKKYKVWNGDLEKIEIDRKFNLVTIRGTIQYFINPKKYFDKISNLVADNGIIYISSSPNSESLCFNLFKDKFTLPVTVTDYWVYSQKLLTKYFKSKNIDLLCDYDFYEQTPYCDLINDIVTVADKIKNGNKCIRKSPAFYGNMLTLVYRKNI